MWQKTIRLLIGVLAIAPFGCGQSAQQAAPVYPFNLTQEEITLARELAERDLPVSPLELPSGPKTYFIKVDLLPDTQAVTTERVVMVHHYAYDGDRTIFTMVDLKNREVLERSIHAHYPTALARAEIDRAYDLARADGRLRPMLDAILTELDARPIQYAKPEEPLFGHRVIHVLLKQDGNYLRNPRVLVDLSTETVHLE